MGDTALTTCVGSHTDSGVYTKICHVKIARTWSAMFRPFLCLGASINGSRGQHLLIRSPAWQRFVETEEEVCEIRPLLRKFGAIPLESERSIGCRPFVLVKNALRLAFLEEEVVPEWEVGVGSGRHRTERRGNVASLTGRSRTDSDVAVVGDIYTDCIPAIETQGERSRERGYVIV
jgi:hypothetical protein